METGVDTSEVDRWLSLRAGDDDLDKELGVGGYDTVGEGVGGKDQDDDTEFGICDISSLYGAPFGKELSPRGKGLLLRSPRSFLPGFNVTSSNIDKCLICSWQLPTNVTINYGSLSRDWQLMARARVYMS